MPNWAKRMEERMDKLIYVKRIIDGHPTYLPDSALSIQARKALMKLPKDVLMYLSLMVVAK